MATRMQQRRGTAAQWISTNSGNGPILSAGEIGFESDTNKFKIGDGVNHWVDLTYFTDAESATAAINAIIDSAPAALNTLNELAAAINDDPSFFTTLASNLSAHEADTTNIHGIADTAALATKTYADSAVSTAVAALTKSSVGLGNVDNTSDANKPISSATQTALNLKAPLADPTFTGTVNAADLTLSGNLTVNGTTTTVNSTAVNVNNQVIFEGATADAYETTLTVIDPTADRTISLPDTSGTLATENYVTSVVTDNAPNYSTLVGSGLQYDAGQIKLDNSYAGEVAMDAVAGSFNSGTGLQHSYDDVANTLTIDIDSTVATKEYADDAVSTHNSDTTSVHGISNTANLVATTDTGTVTSTMIANDTIVNADINASAAIDWTKLAVSSTVSETELGYLDGVTSAIQTQIDTKQDKVTGVSDTEIGYLDGVTSAIQTQIDSKAPSSTAVTLTGTETLTNKTLTSPSITTPTGITKSDVGLGNVDNTADADKPVSTATQTALDLKANLAGPTFTGTTTTGTLVVDGDFTVNGTNFSASATSITIEDNIVQLAHQNASNTVDLGLVVAYNDGTAKHSGLVRDVSDAKWKLFDGVTTEPTTTVNFGQGSLDALAVGALEATTVTPSSGVVFSDGTQTKEGVPSRTPIIQKTDNYTLTSLTERDSLIEVAAASGKTITIPTNATVGFPIGTSIDILQTSTGQVTIAGAAGVTVNATPGLKLRTTWSSATLFKRAENTWVVYGDLTA